PLRDVGNIACPWTGGARKSAPITWVANSCSKLDENGRFSDASMGSEAFVLEYANNMPDDQIAWGGPSLQSLQSMMRLHEFYFDKPDRRRELAKIKGSNLIREIINLMDRSAKRPFVGCPHADPDSRFVGLVGHDTTMASVASLLGFHWRFNTMTDD